MFPVEAFAAHAGPAIHLCDIPDSFQIQEPRIPKIAPLWPVPNQFPINFAAYLAPGVYVYISPVQSVGYPGYRASSTEDGHPQDWTTPFTNHRMCLGLPGTTAHMVC